MGNLFKKLFSGRRAKAGIIIVIILTMAVLVFFFFPRPSAENNGPKIIPSAYILAISESTQRPGVAEIGDIIGVFDGDHQFSPSERKGFIIIKIDKISKAEVESELNKLLPDTSKLTEEEQQARVNKPKYKFNITDVSASEITAEQLAGRIKSNVQILK